MDQQDSDEEVSAGNNDGGQYNPGFAEQSSDIDETFESPAEEDIAATPANISEDDARQSFLDLAGKHCCYSVAPAEDMSIEKIESFTAYKYFLYTFTEERTTYWKTTAYYGEEVDGPLNGRYPGRWDTNVNCPEWFKKDKGKIKVPHTSEVKDCKDCGGSGKIICKSCHGKRKKDCMMCLGSGENYQGTCLSCGGTGKTICFTCTATGKVKCSNCSGKGQVITFLEMKIKWKNLDPLSFVVNGPTELTDRFGKVSGDCIISDEDTEVEPITTFPEDSVNEVSRECIEQHAAALPDNTRIARQRQNVESVPFSKIYYTWRGKQGEYFVYGLENKAYCSNYPKKCCCAIM